MVEFPECRDVGSRFDEDVQRVKRLLASLERRVEFLEANSAACLAVARRALLDAARRKLVHAAQVDPEDAAANWNDHLARFLLDKQLLSACRLSQGALFLTQCGPGTETEDPGNFAAHDDDIRPPAATVRAAIDELRLDAKGPWEEMFSFVYSPTA